MIRSVSPWEPDEYEPREEKSCNIIIQVTARYIKDERGEELFRKYFSKCLQSSPRVEGNFESMSKYRDTFQYIQCHFSTNRAIARPKFRLTFSYASSEDFDPFHLKNYYIYYVHFFYLFIYLHLLLSLKETALLGAISRAQ